jgi:mRNA-degrading endonuclease toxin of MazEF toxin-antitoxin module
MISSFSTTKGISQPQKSSINSDLGKIRPVLIFQNDLLNRMVAEGYHSDIVVIPLSTQIRKNDFAFLLAARDRLKHDSVILCHAVKMIDADRLIGSEEPLTTLNTEEIREIEKRLRLLFDCS